jgi:rRNA maturation RNase YbeY
MKNLRVFTSNKLIRKNSIHKIISTLAKQFGLQISFLEVNIVSSDLVLDLNRKFLKHDYRTDILTFNYSSSDSILEGEIYISLEDATENSKRFKTSLNDELKRLVVHGILHLIGYDDVDKNEKRKMRELENKSLKMFSNIAIID